MPKNITKKCIDIDNDNFEWYEQAYPKGSLTAIINLLLEHFRLCHKLTPEDLAKIAALDVINQQQMS